MPCGLGKRDMPKSAMRSAQTHTAGCLFAGIGGFCSGLKQAKFSQGRIKVLWANEKDKHAAKTYRANYRQTRLIEKDVRDLSVEADGLDPVDILTAGFPCQSFSLAGDQKGFEDERGQLFYEIIRIVREFGPRKPSILLLENVPNLKHGGGGAWFDEVVRAIQAAGYWFTRHNCRVLNTLEITGLPHHRERLFMVAMSDQFVCNNFEFPGINGKPDPLHKFVDKNVPASDRCYRIKPGNRYHEMIERKMKEGDDDSIYQLRRSYVRESKGKCPTLTANMGGGGWNVPFVKDKRGIRQLTVSECANLQGFNLNVSERENLQDFKFISFPEEVPENERYRQIGNAVSVPVAKKLGQRCIKALRSAERIQ